MAGYSTPAWTNSTTPAINASNLLAMGRAIEIAEHPYGVCSTAAATAAKTVTIDYSTTLSALFTGMTVKVSFTNGNTAANPTLNVNSTGAKSIMKYGTTPMTLLEAGGVLTLTYDGTNWVAGAVNNDSGRMVALIDGETYTNSTATDYTTNVNIGEPISNFSMLQTIGETNYSLSSGYFSVQVQDANSQWKEVGNNGSIETWGNPVVGISKTVIYQNDSNGSKWLITGYGSYQRSMRTYTDTYPLTGSALQLLFPKWGTDSESSGYHVPHTTTYWVWGIRK